MRADWCLNCYMISFSIHFPLFNFFFWVMIFLFFETLAWILLQLSPVEQPKMKLGEETEPNPTRSEFPAKTFPFAGGNWNCTITTHIHWYTHTHTLSLCLSHSVFVVFTFSRIRSAADTEGTQRRRSGERLLRSHHLRRFFFFFEKNNLLNVNFWCVSVDCLICLCSYCWFYLFIIILFCFCLGSWIYVIIASVHGKLLLMLNSSALAYSLL